jgi:hypothetical protein
MANGNFVRIWKDAAKAFFVWAGIAAVLVIFFGYGGWMISLGIGLIFLVCFCTLRAAELLAWIGYGLGWLKPGGPAMAPPLSSGAPGPNPAMGSVPVCGTCNGSGQMLCPRCRGTRGQSVGPGTAEGTWQWVPCSFCNGSGSVQCTGTYGTPHTTS